MRALDIIKQKHNNLTEYYITCNFASNNDISQTLQELCLQLKNNTIHIVQAFGFGNVRYSQLFHEIFQTNNIVLSPLTWVEGTENEEFNIDGLYIYGIHGTEVQYLKDNNKIIGARYDDDFATYVYLGGIGSGNSMENEQEQTAQVFRNIDEVLKTQDMEMKHMVRTWFYNKDILSWYGKFNVARTAAFKDKDIFQNLVPASTGIDGRSPINSSLVAGVIAIRPKNNHMIIKVADSPLQGSAINYGSSFSRAVEIKTPLFHKLTISGTASIDNVGNTMFVNDTKQQIEQTFETVEKILLQCHLTFKDVNRAFAYVKNESDLEIFKNFLHRKQLDSFPLITINTTICRDDLLFEIELDAQKDLNS